MPAHGPAHPGSRWPVSGQKIVRDLDQALRRIELELTRLTPLDAAA